MDSALKQRLTGAVVLVAAAVIFLPMILDGAGVTDRVDQAVDIRSPPEPVPARTESPPEPVARETAPAAEPEEPAPEPVPDAPAAGPSGYAVQVGSFTREDNATALRDELLDAGFNAIVVSGTRDGEAIWRVRVGPVSRESEAEELRERVLEEQGEPAIVVRHP